MQNNVFLLSIWKNLTLELCIVKDFIMYLSKHYPMASKSYLSNLQRFSKVTVRFSYSMVTFSVIVVCDVIVFIELLNFYIFKGTLEIYHSELKSVTKYKIGRAHQLKTQNSNLKEKRRVYT